MAEKEGTTYVYLTDLGRLIAEGELLLREQERKNQALANSKLKNDVE